MQPKVGPMGGHLELSWAHVGPQMGHVRLILGHLELSWAHVGLRMGYVRLMLGYLLGHLFGDSQLCAAITHKYAFAGCWDDS